MNNFTSHLNPNTTKISSPFIGHSLRNYSIYLSFINFSSYFTQLPIHKFLTNYSTQEISSPTLILSIAKYHSGIIVSLIFNFMLLFMIWHWEWHWSWVSFDCLLRTFSHTLLLEYVLIFVEVLIRFLLFANLAIS